MNRSINPAEYGFRWLPDGTQRLSCIHCWKILSTARLSDMRAHHGSSTCSWRIATGDAAKDRARLGL